MSFRLVLEYGRGERTATGALGEVSFDTSPLGGLQAALGVGRRQLGVAAGGGTGGGAQRPLQGGVHRTVVRSGHIVSTLQPAFLARSKTFSKSTGASVECWKQS